MSKRGASGISVGNDFTRPKSKAQRLKLAVPVPAMAMPQLCFTTSDDESSKRDLTALPKTLFELFHHYTIIAFAILILLISSTGITVVGNYQANQIANQAKPLTSLPVKAPSIIGLNTTVPTNQLEATLNGIINQPASLTVGDQTKPISPDTIKSWLQITTNKTKTESYIHISAPIINKSLTELANQYVKGPVDQVTSTHPDGSSQVIVIGKNGAKLTDPGGLQPQSVQIAKTLMDAKGLQASTPLETVPFQAVTPDVFGKLLEVNVNTKQMWAWDNGVISRTFPISAGAPSTPTPIGQYKIYSKLPVQDMKGLNPNGSKYFQAHVRWINYFLPGGYAVHGNYWRPLSWFGNINSSHGCVSLPDTDAKWVYDFAPIGTTVITHY